MPSVGMIRSTRVFVPKSISNKDVIGKNRGFNKSSEKNKLVGLRSGGCRKSWCRFVEDSGETPDEVVVNDTYYNSKNNGFCGEVGFEQEDCLSDFNGEIVPSSSASSMGSVSNLVDENSDKMYGAVYTRKRRRLSRERFVSSSQVENRVSKDPMFGKQFVRKHPRKKSGEKPLLTELKDRARTFEVNKEEGLELVEDDLVPQLGVLDSESSISFVSKPPSLLPPTTTTILSFVVESSCGFTCILASVLKFMRKSWLRLSLLGGFMNSEPISRVFSMGGIQILNDSFSKITWKDNNSLSGTCKIFGTRLGRHQLVARRQLVPIFCVDFLAIPHSFITLHSCIALQTQFLPNCLLRYLKSLSSMFSEVGISGTNSSVKKRKVDFVMGATGFSSLHPNVRRKRSSLRTGRVKNTLAMDFFLHSDTDFFVGSDGYNSFSAPAKQKQRKMLSMNVSSNISELKSTLVEPKQNTDVVSCSANVLVIESDKCYREEGAEVLLEYIASDQWRLMIKTQGLIKYSYKAHDQLRPSATNRYTHAMIWTGGNGWKLEFPDRRDWAIFKELHRQCIDRNLREPPAKAIPVPSVCEVPDYENVNYVPFVKPDVYITMPDDELARASMSSVAIYDVDTGDEQWLGELNNDHAGKNNGLEFVSVEKFEEMIDTFEKVAFYCPDDPFDENKAADLCPDLERDVVAPVYQHWLRKRKQKRGPLLRVFQLSLQNRRPKKAQSQVLNRPVSRKRRTTKRQNQPPTGRGKQWIILEDGEREQEKIRCVQEENMRRAREENIRAAQEDNMHITVEEEMRRIEELSRAATDSLDLAVLKRNRAQTLMENADLAAYRATMAVKIAEAAQAAESTEIAASFYLD